jgi:integrase
MADCAVNEHLRRDRAILHSYIQIATLTGIRPTEPKNLNWGDIVGYRECREKPFGERDICIRARGKGKARAFVLMEAALPWFDLLWMFWEKAMGSEPDDRSPVFASITGKRLSSVKKSLADLLTACDLLTDHRGIRRTSYSFRHSYISHLSPELMCSSRRATQAPALT